MYQQLIDRADRRLRAIRLAKCIIVGGPLLSLVVVVPALAGCVSLGCTSTLQRGCDPSPKWTGYSLETRP